MRRGYQPILEMNPNNSAKEKSERQNPKYAPLNKEKQNSDLRKAKSHTQTMSSLYRRTFHQSQNSLEKDNQPKGSNERNSSQNEVFSSFPKSREEDEEDVHSYKNRVDFFQKKILDKQRPSSNFPSTVSHLPGIKGTDKRTLIFERSENIEPEPNFQQKSSRNKEKVNNLTPVSNFHQRFPPKEKTEHEMDKVDSKNSWKNPVKGEFHFKYKNSPIKEPSKNENKPFSSKQNNVLRSHNNLKTNTTSEISTSNVKKTEPNHMNLIQNDDNSITSTQKNSYTKSHNSSSYFEATDEAIEKDRKSKILFFENKIDKPPTKFDKKNIRQKNGPSIETRSFVNKEPMIVPSYSSYDKREADIPKDTKHFPYKENKQIFHEARPSKTPNVPGRSLTRYNYEDSYGSYEKTSKFVEEPSRKISIDAKSRETPIQPSVRSKNKEVREVEAPIEVSYSSRSPKKKTPESHPKPTRSPLRIDSVNPDVNPLGTNNYTENDPLDGVPKSVSELNSFKKQLEKTLTGKARSKAKRPEASRVVREEPRGQRVNNVPPSAPIENYGNIPPPPPPQPPRDMAAGSKSRRNPALQDALLRGIETSHILQTVGPRKEHEVDGSPKGNSGIHIPAPDY